MSRSDPEKEPFHSADLEAGDVKSPRITSIPRSNSVNEDIALGTHEEVERARNIQHRIGVLRNLRRAEEWLDSKLGIELQGIDRVPEEAKRPPSTWNIFLLWWSLNVHVGVIPLGVLGPEFGLSLGQTISAAICGSILGAVCTGYDGTLGPKVCEPTPRHGL